MPVFYRGPRARITHRTFEVWCPRYRVFVIRELRQVQVSETDPAPVASVTWGSSGLAGVAVVILTTGWLDVPLPLVVLTLIAAVTATTGACLRMRAGSYELRAVYRGAPAVLYATSDLREFGQVRRGLVRAIEFITDG